MENPKIKFEFVMFHAQDVLFNDALVVNENEVDAHRSLHTLYEYTSARGQFKLSDIVFVFSGRPVFTNEGNTRSYGPKGLTWEKGICNATTKFVIVSDIGKRFSALPNAAFHLARLLGAPSSCTHDYSVLEGNYNLFNLSSCVMEGIRNHLKKLQNDDPRLASDCFRRSYTTNTSMFFDGLPYSMFDEETFCKQERRLKKGAHLRGRCDDDGIWARSQELYKAKIEKGWTSLDPDNNCFFECCNLDNLLWFTIHYDIVRYAAFDGKPCGRNKDHICVQAQCVKNTTTL
ncbi:uncharacterized protein LOC135399629 [Ornithodoros turicata]|uniref:uncharacterized protein LOC135399629 n=1 Tax=Ornithodoros turicata TaxID=34597 RepID=UPI0031388837